MPDGLHLYDAGQQDKLVDDSVHDVRKSIPTGFAGIGVAALASEASSPFSGSR